MGEAVNTACHLINRLPYDRNNFTPFEKWFSVKPDLSYMRVFGCDAYVWVPDEKRTKLDDKSEKLIFVGYCDNSKAYRLLNSKTCKVTISRHVRFVEEVRDKDHDSDTDVTITGKDITQQEDDDEFIVSLMNKKVEVDVNVEINENVSDVEDDNKSTTSDTSQFSTNLEPTCYK